MSGLVRLLLVMSAIITGSERCFGTLRRAKSYLRATMKQELPQDLMLLHVHEEYIDALNLVDLTNDFVFGSKHTMSTFGTNSKLSDFS